MEIVVWLGITVAVAVVVSIAAPYHTWLIDERPKVAAKNGN
jgi:hypothetical protein